MADETEKQNRAKLVEQTFKREMQFDRAMIDDKARTCELSFSSEYPVDRGGYMEILSHEPEHCDLSRLNSGHPLLLSHDPEQQIGVVEKAWISDDKKGRAIVRFSKSDLGETIWNDVKDGIRRLVSVGYRIIKEVSTATEAGREVCRFAFAPYEISLVSIPADATVGIGRKQNLETSPEQKKESKIMSAEVIPTVDYRKESQEILAIAKNLANKVENVRDLADKAIGEGWTADQFRKQALNQLPEVKPVATANLSEVRAKDWSKYSISRAIGMKMEGGRMDGIEAELHQELNRNATIKSSGILIPDQVFSRSLIAGTGTLGGQIVQTTNMASEFIEILRNRSQVLNLGARVLNLPGPTTIPRQAGAGTVNMVGETVASTLTAINFQQITLTPQAISANHQYSKMLLMESNPSVDALVRDDIVKTIAIKLDQLALHGSGTGEPTGIANTSGVGTVLLATNGLSIANSTAYPFLVSLETAVASANADMGSLGYLIRPGHRGAFRTQARFANSDTPVFDPLTNQVNGYRTEITNQIATNLTTGTATTICSAIFFGNWNELLIADFNGGATDLVVDPYTAGANGVVRLYARRWVDVGVRHGASFAVGGGILTT